MENEYVLSMEGISKQFPGVRALSNVELHTRKGTVHALMGENGAGKSTLMKCLFGIYVEDSGDIVIEGKKTRFDSAKNALDSGVSMVHQELNQVLKMSIMDNIWLGRYPCDFIKVNHKRMYEGTKQIFEEL